MPAMIGAMSKITLKLRDLMSGETSFRELANEEETTSFLKERPRFVDVLGVVFEGLSAEQNARLRAANRPLDAEERAAEAALDERQKKEAEARAEARAKEDEKAQVAYREAMKNADPNRLMEVRWRFNIEGIAAVDPEDTREICEEAKAAVYAWIAERNEWVESRGQMVGEAKLTIYPANLPKPGVDRVKMGTFVPVMAPAKPAS